MLQKAGGSFALTSDVNFGNSFGLESLYFTSVSANPSTAGVLRLANADGIGWTNSTNTADFLLQPDEDGFLQYDGVDLVNLSGTQTLTNKTIDANHNTLLNVSVALGNINPTTANKVIFSGGSGTLEASDNTVPVELITQSFSRGQVSGSTVTELYLDSITITASATTTVYALDTTKYCGAEITYRSVDSSNGNCELGTCLVAVNSTALTASISDMSVSVGSLLNNFTGSFSSSIYDIQVASTNTHNVNMRADIKLFRI